MPRISDIDLPGVTPTQSGPRQYFPDGTAAVPGLACVSETTSGWARTAAGTVVAAILGVTRLTLTALGAAITGRLLVSGQILAGGILSALTTVTTLTTAGNETYTAAQLLGGLILRNPNGGPRTDTTATAALIVAAIPGAAVGQSFEFVVRNTAGAAETITVAGGTDVTISGTATITQNNTKLFLAVLTNVTAGAEAVTVYSLGTLVH